MTMCRFRPTPTRRRHQAPTALLIPDLDIAADAAKHSVSALLAFCIITFLHVAFGELVPKSVALQRGERIALWVSGPMRLLMALFRPAVWSLNGMANITLRMLGLQPAGELDAVHSSEELRFIVRQSRRRPCFNN